MKYVVETFAQNVPFVHTETYLQAQIIRRYYNSLQYILIYLPTWNSRKCVKFLIENETLCKVLHYSNPHKMESNSNIGKLGNSTTCISWQMMKYSGKCTRNFSCAIRVKADFLCIDTLRTLTFKCVTYTYLLTYLLHGAESFLRS